MADFKSLRASDPAHLRAAFAYVGLAEQPGSAHEPRILDMFARAGHPQVNNDETAWCAAFAHVVLGEAGIKGTGELTARSYLNWGEPLGKPERGCIVVFKRGSSTWQGHVAFYLGRDGGRIWVIGGNQSNAVTVASYPESSLLGFRRVPAAAASVPQPEPKEAPMAAVPILKRGSKGVRVVILQSDLRALGFSAGPADGDFGPETHRAVVAFQESMGLEADGEVGPHTSAALEEMLAKRAAARAQPQEYRPDSVTPIGTPRQPAQETGKAPAGPDEPRSGFVVVAVILSALAVIALAYLFVRGLR